MNCGNNNGSTCILCEQGDMGLFGDPLNEADQQKYDNQDDKKETKADE